MKSVVCEYCRAAQGCFENMTHFMPLIVTLFVHIQCSKSPAQISLVFCQFRVSSYVLLLFMISSISWIHSTSTKLISEITEVLMKYSLKI